MSAEDVSIIERFRQLRRTGQRSIRNELVEAHLPLAEAIARRFASSGPEADDVRQVALIGLVKAVDRYDPDRGVRFASFADPTIAGEIRHHFRDRTWGLRVGRRNQELGLAARREVARLAQVLGHTPHVGDIAESLDEPVDDVRTALEARSAYRPESVDGPGRQGERLSERLGAMDRELELTADLVAMRRLLGKLSDRDREVVRLRFEERLPQSEIADRVGVSQMHVSRILRRLLGWMRSQLVDDPRS